MLDKYIETVIQGHGKDDKDTKKPDVQGECFFCINIFFINSAKPESVFEDFTFPHHFP
jgi:hypothetical protein